MSTGALVDHSDVLTCTAGEIAARVRAGTTTAVEVARAHLARIDARDPELGAFQAVDAERMLAEAAAVDGRPDRFALPLAGVPIAVKDNVRVAGHPTRHGSAATSTAPARRDDELVKRLRRAGAVVVGKTRMPELALWGFTQSALGVTRNPRNTARDPGAPAAAVPRRSPRAWRPSPWVPTAAARSASRRPTAAWSASSPVPASCRCPAGRTSTGSGSAPPARSPARPPTRR